MNNHTLSSKKPINKIMRLESENFALRQDISQLSHQVEEMKHLAYFDDETGNVISIADFQQRS
jgi:hypothetical protein